MHPAAVYPFEKLPVYHNTNRLAREIGHILASRDGYSDLDHLDPDGEALVLAAHTLSQGICIANLEREPGRELPIAVRRHACELAIKTADLIRAGLHEFAAREDGDPIALGQAIVLLDEIRAGLTENLAELKPGYDPAKYAARFQFAWPIGNRGQPLFPAKKQSGRNG